MLRTIFVLSIISVGVIAGLWSRFYALLLYVWFALFRPDQWVWIDISSFRPSLMLGLLLVISALLSGYLPNTRHPISIGMLVFLLSGFLGQIDAVNQDTGWTWLQYMARLLVVCLYFVTLLKTRTEFLLMVAVIGTSFGFHAAKAGLASILGGGVRFHDGMVGAFVDNNGYALGAVMIMPFLVAAGQNIQNRWIRLALYSWVPLSMMLVVSTFSRGGALALIASLLVYIWLQRKKTMALIGLGVFATLAIAVVPMPQGYFERVQTIQTYEEIGEGSALARLHFWRVAMDMTMSQPLGIGLRNFEATYDLYDTSGGQYGRRRQVHSSHFEVAAGNGWIGTITWVWLFGYSLAICRRIRARSRDQRLVVENQRFLFTMANCLIVSMSGFVVGGAFIALALNDLTWMTFGLVAALDNLSIAMLAEAREPAESETVPVYGRTAVASMAAAAVRGYRYR